MARIHGGRWLAAVAAAAASSLAAVALAPVAGAAAEPPVADGGEVEGLTLAPPRHDAEAVTDPDAAAAAAQLEAVAARRYVVTWRADATSGARAATLAAVAGDVDTTAAGDDVTIVATASAAEADSQMSRLIGNPTVEHVEPDRVIGVAASNDPGFEDQWGLENVGQTVVTKTGTAGIDINAIDAWATDRGDPSVVVAVIDSGIEVRHADLAGNIWTNPGEVPGNGRDDEGNGYVDDVHGWDFVNDSASVYDSPDEDAHGTEVGGVIAAVTDNRVGVAGVAPDVTIMPLKFLDFDSGTLADALLAIDYAVRNGADVINASWGGDRLDGALADAIAAARIPFIAAAGNAGEDLADSPTYPASYDLANILAVAAVDNQGNLPYWSNRGRSTVDVGAPGSVILTTTSGGDYRYVTGTSVATPFATGAVALALSAAPGIPAPQLLATVRDTVSPLASLADTTISGGMVDAADLVDTVAAGGACPAGAVPANPFDDVGAGSVHAPWIACLAWWGIVKGQDGDTYDPLGGVTRAQMATFVAGLVDAAGRLPADAPDAFSDDTGSTHEPNINALAATGIVKGVDDDGHYAPGRIVTRAEMASFLTRTYRYVTGQTVATPRDWFNDDGDTVHQGAINQVRELRIANGVTLRRFAPRDAVRRDQMATFLAALLDLLVWTDHIPARN